MEAGDLTHRGKAPAPPTDLQLHNRFTVFIANEKLGALSNGASLMAWPDPLRTTRRKQQVIVVGESLLQGMEDLHDLSSMEACCELTVRILWKSDQGLSGPLTTTLCCSSM